VCTGPLGFAGRKRHGRGGHDAATRTCPPGCARAKQVPRDRRINGCASGEIHHSGGRHWQLLVLRERWVTIGALSATPTPDVGLLAEPQTPPQTIERMDDDYF